MKEEFCLTPIQAGTHGYVLKKSTGEDLIPALCAVAAGQKWIPKQISTRLAARKTRLILV